MTVKVRVKRLSPDAQIPKAARKGDVAFDLYSIIDYELRPGERFAVPTGIAVEIPPGYEGQVRPRSGLALKEGITVLNTPGTVDSGYRGEVHTIMINHNVEPHKGDANQSVGHPSCARGGVHRGGRTLRHRTRRGWIREYGKIDRSVSQCF
jgi:dUTP pyrophosphatase